MSYSENFDSNAMAIAENVVKAGISVAFVKSSHKGSIGVADTVAGYRQTCHLVEIKIPGKGLRASQILFITTHPGFCYHVASNSDEYIQMVRECYARRQRVS